MTKTTTQLATNVLERLRVIAAGETPTASDAQDVKDFYATTLAELAIDDLVYWDAADIPDEVFEPLTDMLAGRLAPNFGQLRPDLEASGMNRLARLASQGGTGRVVTGSYF